MMIKWNEIERQQYEDMVSVLLSRLCPNALRIDGKGGDGGRDVQIAHPQDGSIIDAFELKSFTGRMGPKQRPQVARSLKRAALLEPPRWTLVVPIDPTPAELTWFQKLCKHYAFPTRWFGKTWLDEKLSAFPDIQRYFLEGAEGEVIRLLRELREEQARVANVLDVVGRVRTLRERLDEIDPYYRYELSTGPVAADTRLRDVALSVSFGDVRVDLYPKYSGAAQDRPISIKVKLAVGPGDDMVLNALDFGLGATIPSRMISSVTVDAPSGLGGSITKAEIILLPTSNTLDKPITLGLDIRDGDRLVSSWPVGLTERSAGLKGSILTGTDSTGWLKTRLKAHVEAKELEVKFWLNPKPTMPAALLPLFRWLEAFQPPNLLAIRLPGGAEMCSKIRTRFSVDKHLGRVVEALAYLQDRSRIHWEMSPSVSAEEGMAIVTGATLLKGESIDFIWESLNLGFKQWGPELEELLNGCPKSFLIDQDMWIDMDGVRIPIGRIRTHIESARLRDSESDLKALKSGSLSHLRLVPGDSDKAHRAAVSGPR